MQIFGFTDFGGPDATRLLTVAEPSPGPGEVLIAMRAAGVNPADIKVRNGQRRNVVAVRLPMAMGREAAGRVLALGEGVHGFAVGDDVFGATASGTGAFAERVLLEAAATARVPAGLDLAQAACIPVAAGTAYDVLHELGLRPGHGLLVLGAGGGVGTAVLQLARSAALRVVGVASAGKRDLVRGFGGEPVATGAGWIECARSFAPEGFDGLLDLVGGDTLRAATTLLRPGAAPTSIADPGLAAQLGGRGVTRRRTRGVFAEVAELAVRGVLRIRVTAAMPLERAADAVALVEAGHAAGKVVVTNGC